MPYYDDEYEDMIRALWYSDKVAKEDKDFLDKLSTKRRFKFSEKKRIEELYIKTFGQLPKPLCP